MQCNKHRMSSADMEVFTLLSFHYNVSGALYKMKLDQVSEAGARRSWDICHGEELNPVLTEATWILACVDDESPQATLACFVPQSQERFTLRHIEADVQHLCHQQVKQSACDNAAVPSTGEAECRAANKSSGYVTWEQSGHGLKQHDVINSQALQNHLPDPRVSCPPPPGNYHCECLQCYSHNHRPVVSLWIK